MFYLMVLFFMACNEDSINDPIPECNQTDPCATDACRPQDCTEDSLWFGLDTFWSSKIEGACLAMAQSNDIIVVSGFYGLDMFVKGFSKDSGEELWTFFDDRFDGISSLNVYEQTKKVVLQDFKTVIVLDMKTGEKLSEYRPAEYKAHFSWGYLEEDDYYYMTIEERDESDAYIQRSHITDMESWEKVFSVSKMPYEFDLGLISGMNYESGNLVFKCGLIGQDQPFVVSVNINTNDINWIYEVPGKNANNLRQVTIQGDEVYHVAKYGVHALSVHSGEFIWSRTFEGNDAYSLSRFENTIYTQEGNIIWFYTDYIDSDGGALCMDAQTGEVIYDREFNAFDINTVHQHAGVMYFGSNRGVLYAVRTSDGQVLWDTEDQIPFGKYYADCVVLDQEREVLYGFNGQELVAINIADD